MKARTTAGTAASAGRYVVAPRPSIIFEQFYFAVLVARLPGARPSALRLSVAVGLP